MQINKCLIAVTLTFLTTIAIAGKVGTKVNFNQPEKFTDFKTKGISGAKDKERLMKELTQLIAASVAEFLDKGNIFEITINNIDMAGSFLNLGTEYVRTISDSDRIRFDFSYQLFDKKSETIKQGEVRLTNRNPKIFKRIRSKYDHTKFPYEMQLFDNWLQKL